MKEVDAQWLKETRVNGPWLEGNQTRVGEKTKMCLTLFVMNVSLLFTSALQFANNKEQNLLSLSSLKNIVESARQLLNFTIQLPALCVCVDCTSLGRDFLFISNCQVPNVL